MAHRQGDRSYVRAMAIAFHQAGLRVSVVNPRPVRDLAKGMGKLAKTDAIDARMIATYGAVTQPAATVFASEAAAELKARVTRRQQLVEMLSAEKNRRKRLLSPKRDDVDAHIEWLEGRIKQTRRLKS